MDKEKLKKLRDSRKERIKKIQQMVKEQNKIKEDIKKALETGPKSVPEISEMTSYDTEKVMWFVASLKKYGVVAEAEKKGDYFTYKLIGKL